MAQPEVAIICQPLVDFGTLLTAAHQALGYSLATATDATPKRLSDAEAFITQLATMQHPQAAVGFERGLLGHVAISVLVAADLADMLDIYTATPGMAHVHNNTIRPGVVMAVISGTLAQWRESLVWGTNHSGAGCRAAFSKLLTRFEALGLGQIWQGMVRRETAGGLTAITDKR